MKNYIFYIFIILIFSTSCDDFLEIYPETALSSATFFQTESDFEQAVNATYAPLRPIANDRAWLLGEMHSDNTYYARNPLFGATEQQEDIADFALPTNDGITSNTHVLNQYRLDYQIIARANQIIALIDEADIPQESKDNLKGQALFLRGYAYFELVRYFNKAPLHLTPVTQREEAALPLSEAPEIYAQIEQDVSQAAQLLLPKSQQEPGRATSGAANTLLANVYINQKKWNEAGSALSQVISSGEYELIPDYSNVFSTNTGNKNNIESIFEIQFKEGSDGLAGNFLYSFMPRPMTQDELVEITGTSNPQPLTAEGNNIPTPDVIAAYEEGDERLDVSVSYVTLSGSERENKVYPIINKYAKEHSQHNNHGMNWPVYRYAEVLLFMAEVLNEQGNTAEAANYLNQVRNRAGLGDTEASGQDAMRTAIYKERRVELAFENKRYFDLARTGRLIEVITAYGQRIINNPLDYYYPEGTEPRGNAFNNIEVYYGLPADEAALSPYF
ncbi:RagB/SusD family nutrient uptake outer membrane protein [Membranihabitans maritimus]|uniref:RagB/SusD family nutrient uptake outer membrane protein n=1 Tax=Membranihabitans maritimus TaxID=2904244 RepID=UPI001F23462C|nr:RagB/SusD family nutrient uptake outer membrane protein [Membranihabitans maritimus]